MAKRMKCGAYYMEGKIVKESQAFMTSDKKEKAEKNTLSYAALKSHGVEEFALHFDMLAANEWKFLDFARTVFACGAKKLPFPCAFSVRYLPKETEEYALSVAEKLGADFVPRRLFELSEYIAARFASVGGVVAAIDNRAAVGALGTLSYACTLEEACAAAMGQPVTIPRPQTVAVFLRGKPQKGVGPVDIALDLIASSEKDNYLENKILEFIGPGVESLSMDFRMALDRAVTKCGCFGTLWETDEACEAYYAERGRKEKFRKTQVVQPAYYDGAVTLDLSRIEPMIMLPYSEEIMPLAAFIEKPEEAFARAEEAADEVDDISYAPFLVDGKAVLGEAHATCVSLEDFAEAAEILRGKSLGARFALRFAPASSAVVQNAAESGYLALLAAAGAELTSAVDSMGFGDGLQATNTFSVEGCAVMDIRSLTATAACGGVVTSALGLDYKKRFKKFVYDGQILENGVLRFADVPNPRAELKCTDAVGELPALLPLKEEYLLKVVEDPYSMSEPQMPEETKEKFEGQGVAPQAGYGLFFLNREDYEYDVFELHFSGYAAYGSAMETNEETRRQLLFWGILPFTVPKCNLKEGDYVYLSGVADTIKRGENRMLCKVFSKKKTWEVVLELPAFTERERETLLAGGFPNLCGKKGS